MVMKGYLLFSSLTFNLHPCFMLDTKLLLNGPIGGEKKRAGACIEPGPSKTKKTGSIYYANFHVHCWIPHRYMVGLPRSESVPIEML